MFSIENFNRSAQELNFLFNLIATEAEKLLGFLVKNRIKTKFIGDRSLFPKHVLPTCINIERETAEFTTLNLNLLFCYGGQQEIISGIKDLVKEVKIGKITENDINQQVFQQFLWTKGIPEPDIIIRTGGAKRLSNFLLYQAAYSELYFLDCLWPELTDKHLTDAVDYFKQTKRNFGV